MSPPLSIPQQLPIPRVAPPDHCSSAVGALGLNRGLYPALPLLSPGLPSPSTYCVQPSAVLARSLRAVYLKPSRMWSIGKAGLPPTRVITSSSTMGDKCVWQMNLGAAVALGMGEVLRVTRSRECAVAMSPAGPC